MSQEENRFRKVLHLSGRDPGGALTDFCETLLIGEVELLHLAQSSVHGCLVVTAEIRAPQSSTILEDARAFASERGLHLDMTDLPAQVRSTTPCGVWVTTLGGERRGLAVGQIGSTLRTLGLSIARVDSIGESDMIGANILARKEGSISPSEFQVLRETILKLAAPLKVDLAVQRDDVYRQSKRLLCMDVDSTFVKGEFIDELAELCGVKEQVAEITARAMRGELDFEASLRERVKLLKGLEVSRALELCERFELSPGADDLVRTVKRLGMKVGLVSGGFDFFVERLRDRFDLDFTFANELEIEGSRLTGNVKGTIVDSYRKAQVLKDMAHVFKIRPEQTVAAGDGANDIEMLKAAGLGIAYQAKPRLQEIADTSFNQNDRLDTLLYLMGFDARLLAGACSP